MSPLVQEKLPAIESLCRKHAVRRLFLFGSALRPDFDPTSSDVDFLVDFLPTERKGFDDVYFLLLEDLQKLFGREVDLVEAGALRNPYFIANVNRTKRMVYAA